MKFLPFLFFLPASLTIAQHLKAQNDKYIEIAATDTIYLKPIEFNYEISLGSKSFPFNLKKEDSTQNAVRLIDIEHLLAKNNFNFKIEDKSYYSITPENKADSTITLTLNSESELNRLYNILIKVQGISGRISDAKFESLSNYQSEIYKNLYSRALQNANDLAKISGNTIGQLISIHEPQSDIFSGIMDFNKKMFSTNSAFSQLFGIENEMTQQIEIKLVFKFEMK